MRPLAQLLRHHILTVKPYSSARSEYPTTDTSSLSQHSSVFLDANENAFGSPARLHVNRYPDPLQSTLKTRIAEIKNIPPHPTNTIFLGNGSDEPIDLLIRAFCEPTPAKILDQPTNTNLGDEIIITPPTYGMYEVSAAIHNVSLVRVPLRKDAAGFHLNSDAVLAAITSHTKLIFLCSPNNPTANNLEASAVEAVITGFDGIVVIDEAYIDFSLESSFLPRLADFPNVVILQTFSKAWGMAGLRLGMAFARTEIIAVLNTIKSPYNINTLTQEVALTALADVSWHKSIIAKTLEERARLQTELGKSAHVLRVFPSNANFLLVEMQQSRHVYEELVRQNIIVRDRSQVVLCEDCLRITVGTEAENTQLLAALANIKSVL
jgi:histidinol-phosphate aminotransferase